MRHSVHFLFLFLFPILVFYFHLKYIFMYTVFQLILTEFEDLGDQLEKLLGSRS